MTMTTAAPDLTIRNAAWSGHHLVLADEDFVDNKLRRPQLAPTTASGYIQCPAQMAIKRMLPWISDPFAANELGSAAHGVMEDLMALPPAERTRERAHAFLVARADKEWSVSKLEVQNTQSLRANAELRAKWIAEIDRLIDGQFMIEDPTTIDVAGVEFLLDDVLIGAGIGASTGIPLKGYVDRTDWVPWKPYPSGIARAVRDYKFGKPKVNPNLRYGDDYGDQLRIYSEGYAVKTGERPVEATLLFPKAPLEKPGANGIRKVDISPGATRTTLLGFRTGWNTMHEAADRRSYEARPSALCGWCPAANSCPVARFTSAKAKESAKGQPSALQLGIPVLRPGASVADVRSAPGVSVPTERAREEAKSAAQRDHDRVIEPVGDDLFPITLPGDQAFAGQDPDVAAELAAVADQIAEQADAALADEPEYIPVDDSLLGPFETVHVESRTVTTAPERTTDMTHPDQPLHSAPEAPPYEPEVNGRLNLNSYAAIGVSSIVALAHDQLRKHDVRMNRQSLQAFATTLAGIVLRVQKASTGSASFQVGANTRLRGFLFSAIEHVAPPFRVRAVDGQQVAATADDWKVWVSRIETILTVQLSAATDLYQHAGTTLNDSPESFFAVGGQGEPAPIAPTNADQPVLAGV